MASREAYVFVDANTALHFVRPDQIDWQGFTQCEHVVLVAAPVFTRELEYQKIHNPSRRLRARADAYIKWLVQFVREPAREVRPQTRWHFIPTEPAIDFAANNLSPSVADDHLIASVLAFASPSESVLFVATADVGLEIKLRHRKIASLLLPDSLRLPEEIDPQEKELQNLRRQLAQQRAPVLKLVGTNGDRHEMKVGSRVVVPSAPSLAQVREENKKISPITPPKDVATLTGIQRMQEAAERSLLSPERVAAYNQRLDSFLTAYEEYLGELLEWQETRALTIELELSLINEGTAPANDVDVALSFPPDLVLMTADALLPKPQRPKPPRPPDTSLGLDIAPLPGQRGLGDLMQPRDVAIDVHTSTDISANGHDVTYWVRNLKHGFDAKIESLYVRFANRDAVRQFSVDYEISAAELPRPAMGQMHFVFPDGQLGATR